MDLGLFLPLSALLLVLSYFTLEAAIDDIPVEKLA